MRTRSPILFPGVLGVTAVLTLAACGSSTSKTSSTTGYGATATTIAPAAAAPPTTAAGQPLVKTKTDPKLGTILADTSGKTLYTLTDNNGQAVACTASCVAVWPPLEAPPGVTTPTGGPGVTGLGVVAGPNGTQVVTVNNLPVYRFAKDAAEGDAFGEGIQSFGGTWHVVKA